MMPVTGSTFYSCDWGTSSFRLRLADRKTGEPLREIHASIGARDIFSRQPPEDAAGRAEAFARFLSEQLARLGSDRGPTPPVLISGMAASSIGWREVPCATVPFPLDGSSIRHETLEVGLENFDAPARVRLISGIATRNEMMRGEESELVGLFADPALEDLAANCVVILPGTHCKHVRIREHLIEHFATFMTGELYDVLARHSILAASLPTGGEPDASLPLEHPQSMAALLEGFRLARDPGLAASLFQTRSRTVLQGQGVASNHWFLRALLIGTELACLAQDEEETPVLLAAPPAIHPVYRLALESLMPHRSPRIVAPDEVARATVRAHHQFLLNWGD